MARVTTHSLSPMLRIDLDWDEIFDTIEDEEGTDMWYNNYKTYNRSTAFHKNENPVDLGNLPFKTVKIYEIDDPWTLDRFKFDETKLVAMLAPNFADFNDLFSRASRGLCAKKTRRGKLICYNKIGILQNSTNMYANKTNGFDILQNGHLALVDSDNAEGIEYVKDFLDLKNKLISDFDAKVIPYRDKLLAKIPHIIQVANCYEMVDGDGYTIQPTTTILKMEADKQRHIEVHSRDYFNRPFCIKVDCGSNTNHFEVHPRLKKGDDKTITEFRDNVIISSICLTDVDLTATINKFIKRYNLVIKDFNDGIEILKKKYLAEYMLNSVGLKDSMI